MGPQQLCGNGLVEGLEQCDDGNTSPGDGCSSTCQVGCTVRGRKSCKIPIRIGTSCNILIPIPKCTGRPSSVDRLMLPSPCCPSHGHLPIVAFLWSPFYGLISCCLLIKLVDRSLFQVWSQAKQGWHGGIGHAALRRRCEPCIHPGCCFHFR